ncbi:MAG: SDR family oxidoreductase [Gemmatimonadota bacterium]|nr:MAG: SDR family oxidoreductase [Gemmatimonadota bacterium]
MIDPGLTGRVALVTGGNNPHGIGAATAEALAAQGVAVLIHFFRLSANVPERSTHKTGDPGSPGLEFYLAMQAKSADEVVGRIRDQGGRAESWEANLGDPAVIPELFDRAEQAFGPVDILVNNAADYEADTFLPESSLERGDPALWAGGPIKSTVTAGSHDRHFAVNTRAVALMTAEFAGRHLESERSWGRIINVSADCSRGCPGEVSYRASKYALESYSRSAAAELGPLGITVNVVSPGPVQTGYIAPELERELVADIALRRVGRPQDIADAIVFLASEQAGWVTGQLLVVHGGHRMSLGL